MSSDTGWENYGERQCHISEQEELALKHGVGFVDLCVSGIGTQAKKCIYFIMKIGGFLL